MYLIFVSFVSGVMAAVGLKKQSFAKVGRGFLLASICAVSLVVSAESAHAQYDPPCDCGGHEGQHVITRADIFAKFVQMRLQLEAWMSTELKDTIVEDWREELSQQSAKVAGGTQLQGIISDATDTNRHAMAVQSQSADMAVRLLPDQNTCSAGTAVEFLARTEEDARVTAAAGAAAVSSRQAMLSGTPQASGEGWEKETRFKRCIEKYCDLEDHGGNVVGAVDALKTRGGLNMLEGDERRTNADIDYGRSFAAPLTLDVDGSAPDDGAYEDMLTMASYLYGHDQFFNLTRDRIDSSLFDVRALQAKRNLVANSFLAQMELKAKSKEPMSPEMLAAYQNLGFSGTALADMVGENPSYHAQMDVLTRRLYQDPQFYTNLVTTRENLDSQATAMDAFANMQMRDLYESLRRQELLFAVLLEAKIGKQAIDQDDRVLNPGVSPEPSS